MAAILPPRALYLHIPLCASKCAYCDFYSLPRGRCPDPEDLSSLVDALLQSLDEGLDAYCPGWLPGSSPFGTVYIGGGTPTVLPPRLLGRLCQGIGARLGPVTEWTLEANPESLDEARLEVLARHGVNRLSLGIQSLEAEVLADLGRPAGPEAIEAALALTDRAWRGRLSCDLIAGLPRRGSLKDEVDALLSHRLDHLSIYDLTLEEGTALAARVARGDYLLPEGEAAYEERAATEGLLAGRGFRRYEVSNYALEGAESLHNLTYWRLESYLGVGPGAVSTFIGVDSPGTVWPRRGASTRRESARDLGAFLATGGRSLGGVDRDLTVLSPRDSFIESLLMGFRTAFGPDLPGLELRYGKALRDLVGGTLEAWNAHLAPPRPWPAYFGGGPERLGRPAPERRPDEVALDGAGLDLLNAFLVDCLSELDRTWPAE